MGVTVRLVGWLGHSCGQLSLPSLRVSIWTAIYGITKTTRVETIKLTAD